MGTYVTRLIKIDERVIVILDLEHLMLDYDPELKSLSQQVDVEGARR